MFVVSSVCRLWICFFFKQKTAYEMRISDWSSDVALPIFNSGVVRYDLGFFELYEGISFIAIAMGLFGVSEVIFSITESVHKPFNQAVTLRSMLPTRAEIRPAVLPVLRGAGIGGLFGPPPAPGPPPASSVAYPVATPVAQQNGSAPCRGRL